MNEVELESVRTDIKTPESIGRIVQHFEIGRLGIRVVYRAERTLSARSNDHKDSAIAFRNRISRLRDTAGLEKIYICTHYGVGPKIPFFMPL